MNTQGTKEWADTNINIQHGCSNGCLYCYAAKMAVRFGRFQNLTDWTENPYLNTNTVQANYKKRKGRIMFPTSHDICENNWQECKNTLLRLVKAGNNVLITTKPYYSNIASLCDYLMDYQDQVQFRFTMTSYNDALLQKWEPHAPSFRERELSLQEAYYRDFKTSISLEPYLDSDPYTLIEMVESTVTESIWLGVMNSKMLLPEARIEYNKIKKIYSKESLRQIIPLCKFAAKGKLRLKDSIRHLMEVF
jgi:DNA repair photolyase